ncbi:hypothetical protein G7Y89_g10714 [Cudoniella acicularis]|uniref:Pectate lyase n=1 Tax=Cudoniella acicularis TaxID=354080 RepID=A0A8H4RF14_9HELO|nr:hypothetical protein G7Y89_g10714 [Cudoniella acicularis]
MKYSTINIAILALALGVTAAPSHPQNGLRARDCDEDISSSTSSLDLKPQPPKSPPHPQQPKPQRPAPRNYPHQPLPQRRALEATPRPRLRHPRHPRVRQQVRQAETQQQHPLRLLAPLYRALPAPRMVLSLLLLEPPFSLLLKPLLPWLVRRWNGGDSGAVFQIENGGSLSHVIIGPNQIEGVHCQGACTLANVWWSAVCEDAFSIKNQDAGEATKIISGSAFGAMDKVVQHNGTGTVSISDFTVDTFRKLYRSCRNCKTMYERHFIIDGLTATDGKEIAGINSSYGDSATITNSQVSGVTDVCITYTGTDDNSEEPVENGSGNDGTYCIYGSDVVVS